MPILEPATSWLIWIPLLPLFGAAINGFLIGRLSHAAVTTVALGSTGLSFLVAVSAFWKLLALPGAAAASFEPHEVALTQHVYDWMTVGNWTVGFGLLFDNLSAVMTLVVTGIGFLIHLFSTAYMASDPGYQRYFTYLNLFMGSMLLLVLGDSLLITFIGWEGVGLCSYLLIGFWFEDDEKASAGKKAFIVNRIGDFGVLTGMFILFYLFGTVEYAELRTIFARTLTDLAPGGAAHGWIVAATLLLFLGCTGKSAQIPLYVWLPDAMAGPTPVSALIHAATMVTAGVYLIARLSFVFVYAPETMLTTALVGATTAAFAASMGLFQNDIKKVLAYSTVSQLGYMFAAVGVGAFTAGIFHVFTHAFFKACLFLGSGSVIHGNLHEQDMRYYGGLRALMPITHLTFLIATLALAGFPPFAGFFSKDTILWHAFAMTHSEHYAWAGWTIWGLGAVAALGTSFYMFRLYYMTFSGESRLLQSEHARHHLHDHGRHGDHGHVSSAADVVHESPAAMTIPLLVLAAGSVLVGFLGVPGVIAHTLHIDGVTDLFGRFLHQAVVPTAKATELWHIHAMPHEQEVVLEWTLMGASVAIAIVGFVAARLVYRNRTGDFDGWAERSLGAVQRLIAGKYYIDELYDALIVRPFVALSRVVWRVGDEGLVDGVGVNGSALGVELTALVLRRVQTGNVQFYLIAFTVGAAGLFLMLI